MVQGSLVGRQLSTFLCSQLLLLRVSGLDTGHEEQLKTLSRCNYMCLDTMSKQFSLALGRQRRSSLSSSVSVVVLQQSTCTKPKLWSVRELNPRPSALSFELYESSMCVCVRCMIEALDI